MDPGGRTPASDAEGVGAPPRRAAAVLGGRVPVFFWLAFGFSLFTSSLGCWLALGEDSPVVPRFSGVLACAALFAAALRMFAATQDRARAMNELHGGTYENEVMESLWESEKRLRAIVETTPECIKLVAADGTILQINPAGVAILDA